MNRILKFAFFLTIGISFFFIPVFSQTNSKQDVIVEKQDTLVAMGKLIKIPMITKKNTQSPYVNDYYFKTGDKEYFIKYKESAFTKDSLDKYLDKNIKITYLINNGNWDSVGLDLDNPVQSRIGQYIVILILKEE